MNPTCDLSSFLPESAGGSVDPLLTDREASAELNCGLSTFRRWVAQGLVPKPLKLGGTSRWPRSEILAVIEAAKTRRDGSSA
ncbi:helix-turn-helix transcriptional regulator [Rubellimicrobium roseum]|uniref:Helix-turn-helix domain-containing protein n=1 Tax=Rubellimicrobium roseum TaxID=687525 RepID=A0A5C4N4W3_9RHOB|nr:helix-turn-helix domain-containing protein [Rubellimicrobium roseum]